MVHDQRHSTIPLGMAHGVWHATLDALAPLGVTTIDMPLTPDNVWAHVQEARQRQQNSN